MNETDSLEADNIEVKEGLHRHESSNDWDDLGIDFENASQTVSTNESSNTPKSRSNLDEVIDLVIQDAIDYADAPQEKRILPKLVRKSTKSRSKQLTNNNTNSTINCTNNGTNFSTVQNDQMTTNNHTANALMTQAAAANNASLNSIHPLMQANFGHTNMQQMAAQLQLAASGKGLITGANTNSSLMQHSMLAGAGATNSQTQQQQLTAAMMGFGASQLPNMMMPTYNGSVPITYHQQMGSGQYHLPVTFAQIQQLHQQQQQQSQQHQQSQSHAQLGSSANGADMSAGTNSQQTNMNFTTGSTSNPQQQQSMLPSSYSNFSNHAISVTPYQIPGMMHAFASSSGPASSAGSQLMSPGSASGALLNGGSSGVSNSSRYLSSSNISNVATATSSNATSPNIAHTSNNALSSNNSNIDNISISNSNTSLNLGAPSSIAAASMASLYQQLPSNTFDFHQQQLLYNQRLFQTQQQLQTTNTGGSGILSDYTVSRYGAGGSGGSGYQ